MTYRENILILSILFQLASAILAVRLIWVTKKKIAWFLVASGITLMTVRRIESLVMLVSGGSTERSELAFEIVGHVISALLLAGIYLIRPLFTSIAQTEEEREKLILELQEAVNNIRTLRGMLPICASCKKIRDDKGYWTQIESYVSQHTEAEFSHGICPECAKKLYPEYCLDRPGTRKE